MTCNAGNAWEFRHDSITDAAFKALSRPSRSGSLAARRTGKSLDIVANSYQRENAIVKGDKGKFKFPRLNREQFEEANKKLGVPDKS
jgi:hypothetical protein